MELLSVKGLSKEFVTRSGFGSQKVLKAVDNVSFSLQQNNVLALVGESGCGKSTTARLVLRLIDPTSGNVIFKGRDLLGFNRKELKAFRKSCQIIFQDPFASLNPRRTVFDTVSEPLVIHRLEARSAMREKVADILSKVGLGPDALNRYPHEFSGGQRQRICIARALAVSPEVIVADEPLSALDVSIQAQILNLLHDLRRTMKISFLFISHDLRVVRYFSDSVAVMYLGKIIEQAETEELFARPSHPYTVMLLESAPKIKGRDNSLPITHHPASGGPAEAGPSPITALGDVPSPINIPPGCPFHPRCPKRFEPCDKIVPELKDKDGRLVACHLF